MTNIAEATNPRGHWIPEPMINSMSVAELRSAVDGTPLNYMTLQAVCRRLLELAEKAEAV